MNGWRKLGIVTPLVAGLLSLGCEDGGRSPALPTAPEAAAPEERGAAPMVRSLVVDDELRTSELIGVEGGELHLAGHTLTVPAGAVEQPTTFVMTVLPDVGVEVDLLAVATGVLGPVDVGEAGFHRPVTLTLSYAGTAITDDPQRLVIAHRREDGTLERLPSRVDTEGHTVSADLAHFSRYCLATD